MVRIKDNRREKAEKFFTPKPEWAEAFMILLLHKTGGSLTVSLADLERLSKSKTNNRTQMSIDREAETATLCAPEYTMPELR